jgi:hypothetical protein
MPNTTSLFIQPIAAIRAQLRQLRQARASQQSLRRDLATYTTDSDLNDLGAILDRYDDSDTRDIRRILTAQRH